MGYLNNNYATRETYGDDGFLHTGDLGSIDEIGLVTIHDRIKELIKVRTEEPVPQLFFLLHSLSASKFPSIQFRDIY